MKTAVVFYSLDGNCAFIASQIKKHMDADLLQLHVKNERKRSFWGKMFWGCGMVFFRKKPPLLPYTFNPDAYDLIVLGAPVWAGTPAPPLTAFLNETAVKGKKIALFVCHAGNAGESLQTLKTLLSGSEIAAEIDFNNAVKNTEETIQKIEEFTKQLS